MKETTYILLALLVGILGFFLGKKNTQIKTEYVTELKYKDTCSTVILVDSFAVYQEIRKGLIVEQRRIQPKKVTPIPLDTVADFMDTVIAKTLDPVKIPKLVHYDYKSDLLQIDEYAIVVGDIVAFDRAVKLDTLLLKTKYTTTIVNTVREPIVVRDYPTKIGVSGMVTTQGGFGAGAYTVFPQGQMVGAAYDFRNKAVGITAGLPILSLKKRK